MRNLTTVLWGADLGVFALASLMYAVQGGFGGGHGRFDLAIYVLGVPWVLVPWPDWSYARDFHWLILIPFVMNSAVVGVVVATGRGLARLRKDVSK